MTSVSPCTTLTKSTARNAVFTQPVVPLLFGHLKAQLTDIVQEAAGEHLLLRGRITGFIEPYGPQMGFYDFLQGVLYEDQGKTVLDFYITCEKFAACGRAMPVGTNEYIGHYHPCERGIQVVPTWRAENPRNGIRLVFGREI